MDMKSFCSFLIVLVLFTVVPAQQKPPTESAMSRFLRYVKIDTQSAEDQPVPPSTKKQFDLARLLEKELKDTKNQLEVALALKHELQISLKDMEADCNAARAQLQECLLDMNQRKSMNEEKKEGAEVEDCFQQDLDDTVELEKQVILLTAQVKYFRTKYEAEQEQKKQLEDLFKLNV